MSDSISSLRLQDAWRECERNAYHLCRALDMLSPILPMTGERFERLTDAQIQTLDQWSIRNKFAHDYPDDGEKNAALINVACEATASMYGMLEAIEKKLKLDHPAFDLGKPLPVPPGQRGGGDL